MILTTRMRPCPTAAFSRPFAIISGFAPIGHHGGLLLRGPKYHPIWVSVGINVVAGRSIAEVNAAVKSAVLAFLSPLPPEGKEQLDSQAALLTTPQDAQVQKGWPLRNRWRTSN